MKHLLISIFLLLAAHLSYAGEIVVNPNESLHEALRKAREWRRTNDPRCQDGITIIIEEGRYYMNEPLFLRPEDSGTKESPLVIRGIGEKHTSVICGDPRQKHRQIWPLKEQDDGLPKNRHDDGLPTKGMERMIDFNTTDRTITIPTPPQNVLQTKNLEMVVHQRWAIAILRVKEMKVEGDKTIVSFMEPESRLEFEHPWPQPVIGGERGNSSFLLRTTEQRDGIEQLVIVDGANYVRFEGLTFKHTCWNRPLHKGHVTLQGGFPLVDAYKLAVPGLPWDKDLENQAWVERPVSAVTVRNAHHVDFHSVLFENLAATALDFVDNVSDCVVQKCTFGNIGGTAIMGGSFAESPREVHRPYTDLAKRCQRLTIKENFVVDAANEDWGAVGIALGYVRHCTISKNHVFFLSYSGICVGWGWTPLNTGMEHNCIEGNNVSNYARQLYDAGGIYTLSNQPGSVISGNKISAPYPAPYATNYRGFRIYLDARTDGFTIENNYTGDIAPGLAGRPLTNQRPIRRDEIGDNHPGPNIIFKQ
ncbi:MAG: right-handed parallel beta-helix repeat-containing protein [Prevotella sp.]|nr:right-handed parallel beta-helix repeat-containing protein [Prevotella sp.]